MKKQEIIAELAKKVGLPKKTVTAVLDGFLEVVKSNIAKGQKIEIRGFGVFSVRKRNARKSRNPKTGEIINVPAKNYVHFKAGKELQESAAKASL